MKNVYLVMTAIMMFCMLLMPLLSVPPGNGQGDTISGPKTGTSSTITAPKGTVEEFLVYNSTEKKVVKMSVEEYLLGVVAAEMPAEYHAEALKAQTVAAYTFACRKRAQRLASAATSSGEVYDITTDSQVDQAYLSPEALKQKWGDKTDEYTGKIKNAIKEVKGYLITYNKEPILAAYHSISSGKTESAKNVWGSDYPYLKPTDSIGDLLSPNYLSEVTFSTDKFKEILTGLKITPGSDPATFAGQPKRSESGTVLTQSLCGKELTGKDIRTAFSLRSANYDLKYANNIFTFTVRGYGHGVGMSQYGANYMALQGSTFLEILSWYYSGCTMSR